MGNPAGAANWHQWNYDAYGGPGFGTADMQHALGLGYSGAQMRILGQMAQSQGRNIGSDVRQYLDTSTQQAPWGYTDFGGPRFGQQDLQAVLGMGGSYKDVQKHSDWANSNQIGTASDVTAWLAENKDNYAYMDANQRREIALKDQLDLEKRSQDQWVKNQEMLKEMNPRITAQNQRMKASHAGGVAHHRSTDFRREGGTRSTAQAGRGMFIESLNI